jgi:hypothetical protein
MFVDPTTLAEIYAALKKGFQELREWVTWRRAQATALEEREINAIRTFQTAVIETGKYLARRDRGENADRSQQEELANLWEDASIAFYAVNRKIVPLLHLKAYYLSRGAQWIDDKATEAGITLDEMNELLTELLTKGDTSSQAGSPSKPPRTKRKR